MKVKFVCVALWAVLAMQAQTAAVETKVRRVPAKATTALDGKDLFRDYCAVCHGPDGKGAGPAAQALKVRPSDLTAIARKNHGKYPEVRVSRVIQGEGTEITAHGTPDMPVWGPIFRRTSTNPDVGAVKVFNLVKYIESIQAK